MKNGDGDAIQVASGSPMRMWIRLEALADGALLARLIDPVSKLAPPACV